MNLFSSDEERAFNKTFHDHFPLLVNLAHGLGIDDNHTAETIVNDSFMDLLKDSRYSYRQDGILKLLIVTVRNDCYDYLRNRNRKVKKQREYEQWASGQPFNSDDPLNDPQIVEGELFQKLREALEKLPPKQRETVKKAFQDGTLAKELAKQLGVKDSTFSTNKTKALENLRKMLGHKDTMTLLIINFLLNEHLKN